jgi:hypothetical protein
LRVVIDRQRSPVAQLGPYLVIPESLVVIPPFRHGVKALTFIQREPELGIAEADDLHGDELDDRNGATIGLSRGRLTASRFTRSSAAGS